MPELPDLTAYREALERLTIGQRLVKVRLVSPFLLRTTEPPLSEAWDRFNDIENGETADPGTDIGSLSRASSDDHRTSALEEAWQ